MCVHIPSFFTLLPTFYRMCTADENRYVEYLFKFIQKQLVFTYMNRGRLLRVDETTPYQFIRHFLFFSRDRIDPENQYSSHSSDCRIADTIIHLSTAKDQGTWRMMRSRINRNCYRSLSDLLDHYGHHTLGYPQHCVTSFQSTSHKR